MTGSRGKTLALPFGHLTSVMWPICVLPVKKAWLASCLPLRKPQGWVLEAQGGLLRDT